MPVLRLALVAGLALVLSACGGKSAAVVTTPAVAGATVFANASCGGCHTLAAANATGRVGPDLDTLRPDEQTVARQVRLGGNGMPSFGEDLTKQQIADVAAYVASAAAQGPAPVAAGFTPNKKKLSQCGTDPFCYQQAFGNVAYNEGPYKALQLFVKEIADNATVHGGCHLIAHAIGAGALVRFKGDAGKAFIAGGNLAMTCWSGYYHGILQRAFLGVPRSKMAATARKLCTGPAVHKNEFVFYQCVHGLGHGLLIYTGYNLPVALKTCDSLDTSWEQTSCTGGVFMENVTPSLGIVSPWLKKSDPLFPCDAVATKDKHFCYLMVTSHVLDVDGGNWQKTAAWCRKAETGWVATCFESFGRDVSGRTLQNPKKIDTLCKLAGSYVSDCVYAVSRDITSMDAGARRATPFCAQVGSDLRAQCFRGIGTILGSFSNRSSGRKAICNAAVPRVYWRDCYAGANV
jgi:mono/diheme cytochrome c family protein